MTAQDQAPADPISDPLRAEIDRLHLVLAEWAVILRAEGRISFNDARKAIGLSELAEKET